MADGSATHTHRQIHSRTESCLIQLGERVPEKLSNGEATTASATGSTDDFKSGISGNGYLVPESRRISSVLLILPRELERRSNHELTEVAQL